MYENLKLVFVFLIPIVQSNSRENHDTCSPILVTVPDEDLETQLTEISYIKQLMISGTATEHSILNLSLRTKKPIKYFRPHQKFLRYCFISIVQLRENFSLFEDNSLLLQNILTSIESPLTYKYSDKYIFIIPTTTQLQELSKIQFFRKLNQVLLILDQKRSKYLEIFRSCHYCYESGQTEFITKLEKHKTKSKDIYNLFMDTSYNFNRYRMKISFPLITSHVAYKISKTGQVKFSRGVYCTMVRHMAQKLNFTYSPAIATAGNTGVQAKNGTWTGTVSDVLYNRSDFGLLTAPTYKRYQYVSFSAAVSYEFVSFYYSEPEKIYSWKAIYWPFRLTLWVAIFVSFLLILLVSTVINFLFVKKKQGKTKMQVFRAIRMAKSGAAFVNPLLEQGTIYPTSWSESFKVLLTFWLFFALIISTIYRSKMVTVMTFPMYEKIPANFEELATSNFKYGLLDKGGGASYSLFKNSETPTFVNIFKSMTLESDPMDCLLKVVQQRFVCISYSSVASYYLTRNFVKFINSKPKLSPSYAFYIPAGLAVEKQSLLLPRFNWIIRTSIDMGLVEQWFRMDAAAVKFDAFKLWKRKLELTKMRQQSSTQDESFEGVPDELIKQVDIDKENQLKIHQLKGSFVVVILGSIVGIIAFFSEVLLSKYNISQLPFCTNNKN